MKKILTVLGGAGVVGVVVVALAAPAISLAAYVAAGQTVGLPATVASSTNAYLAGGTVDATSPVNGDLLAGGGTVVISSAVANDIMAAGGTINILGASAQDVRVVGGNITIDGKFSGELMAAGGTITVTQNSTIAKDSYIVGGNVYFDGTVNGNLSLKRVGKLTIGPNAVVKGNLEYGAATAAIIEPGAQITGKTTFNQIAQAPTASGSAGGIGALVAIISFWLIVKFLAVLTAAYLLWYLCRKDMVAIIDGMRGHFWKKLFVGFAFVVLVPVGALILFITLIGAVPAIVAFLTYFIFLALAGSVAIILVTSLLMALFKKSMTELRWYHILLGAIVYSIIAFIPFVGWIASCIVYLVALGGWAGVVRMKFTN